MEFHSYIFLGVGVAISVLGFFLKKESKKQAELEDRVKGLEVSWAKNEARDQERYTQHEKLLEDRRDDCRKLYDLIK